jgi:hypothetical protein
MRPLLQQHGGDILANSIDFFSGRMDCEVCMKRGTNPPGKMRFTGKRFIMEHERDFWRFSEYEMECDKCGAKMTSKGAGPRPGLRWSLARDTIEKI